MFHAYPHHNSTLALQVEILLIANHGIAAQLQHLQTNSSPHFTRQLHKGNKIKYDVWQPDIVARAVDQHSFFTDPDSAVV